MPVTKFMNVALPVLNSFISIWKSLSTCSILTFLSPAHILYIRSKGSNLFPVNSDTIHSHYSLSWAYDSEKTFLHLKCVLHLQCWWNCLRKLSEFSLIGNLWKLITIMAPTMSDIFEENPRKNDLEEDYEGQPSPSVMPKNMKAPCTKKFTPHVVVFVGLPARNKTVTAHKLCQHLNWIGHKSKVFSVSEYRRKCTEQYCSHDFFCADNKEAMEIRKRCAVEAIEDAVSWLSHDGTVAILDGTNSTRSRRQMVYELINSRVSCKVLFVESICDDEGIIQKNIKEIKENSPDYKEMSREKAHNDFLRRIEHYRDQYEKLDIKCEGRFSFIKIFNAGENISAHRLDGHLQSKILYYLSNFKPQSKTLYFSRHGESEYNLLGRIGGDTDLSPRGQMYAKTLARHINDAAIPDLCVWTSEKKRTKQTAQGIQAPVEHLDSLNELDAGVCEGLSYEDMQEQFPQEFAWRDQDKLRYRYPWGESYVDIMARLEPVLMELEQVGNILVVSHQAVLRCILGYFLNKKPEELPYMNVPLHTVIKLTTKGYNTKVEYIKLPVECVDTYREKPKNCAPTRSTEDALLTVPSHFNSIQSCKQLENNLIPQH